MTRLATMHGVLHTKSLSEHSKQTRCKCGKRITVDDVHFECRFVKPLWSIIAQANRLTVNGIDTTNTTGIL